MEEYYYMLVKNTLENYDKEKAIKMIMKRLCDLEEDKTILERQREDYKKELDILKTKYNDVQNNKIKRENELYEEKKQIVNKYKTLEERLEHKENKIKKYINDYMSSDKKSNIAIKHLKEILKILEEIE